MKKLRIAQIVTLVTPDGAYGGPVRVAANQGQKLRQIGHEVTIFGGYSGYATAPTNIDGVPAKLYAVRNFIPATGFAGTMSFGLLKKIWSQIRDYDIVHIHLARDFITLPAALITLLRGIPYVVQTHGMIDESQKLLSGPLDLVLTRRVLKKASTVFYLTHTERTSLEAVAGSDIFLRLLINGVPISEPPPENDHAGMEVLYLARLQARKRPALFVQAAALLIDKYPTASFSLVGPDEGEGSRISQTVSRMNSPRLRWEGALAPHQTLERMGRSSIYVLPSIDEPFPMSVLEALSVGLPVILTDTCGLASAVKEANAGLVIGTDPDELGQAIERLLSSRNLRLTMSANALKLARTVFTMDVVAGRLLEVYSTVIAERSSTENAKTSQ